MNATITDLQRQVTERAHELSNRLDWAKEYAEYHGLTDDEEIESLGGYEYLEDVLDINYIVNRDGSYKSAKVLIAFGGPNIWINFDTNTVDGYWGGDEAHANFTDDIGVEDILEEMWGER